jgi:hypothetical protein
VPDKPDVAAGADGVDSPLSWWLDLDLSASPTDLDLDPRCYPPGYRADLEDTKRHANAQPGAPLHIVHDIYSALYLFTVLYQVDDTEEGAEQWNKAAIHTSARTATPSMLALPRMRTSLLLGLCPTTPATTLLQLSPSFIYCRSLFSRYRPEMEHKW